MKRLVAAALLGLAALAARAEFIIYTAHMMPEAAGATGSGLVRLTFDTVSHDLAFDVSWSGLSGTTSVAHIHCCLANPGTDPLVSAANPTVGVAVTPVTLPGFPTGLSAGSYTAVVDLDLTGSYTAAFLGANGGTAASAMAAVLAGMNEGRAYFNIHTNRFPGGEIRGFIRVPEPGTFALAGLALGLLALAGWRRQRS